MAGLAPTMALLVVVSVSLSAAVVAPVRALLDVCPKRLEAELDLESALNSAVIWELADD